MLHFINNFFHKLNFFDNLVYMHEGNTGGKI
jgi:hypothetical protein